MVSHLLAQLVIVVLALAMLPVSVAHEHDEGKIEPGHATSDDPMVSADLAILPPAFVIPSHADSSRIRYCGFT